MKLILLTGLLALGGLGLTGCGPHTQGWKQADLERNRLNLGLFRMREAAYGPGMLEQRFTAAELADSVEYGEVVGATGTARLREGGDLEIVVRYAFSRSGLFGSQEPPEVECWRFTTADGYDVAFDEIDCP